MRDAGFVSSVWSDIRIGNRPVKVKGNRGAVLKQKRKCTVPTPASSGTYRENVRPPVSTTETAKRFLLYDPTDIHVYWTLNVCCFPQRQTETMPITVFTGPDPNANLEALLGRTPLRCGPVCAVVPDARSVTHLERALTRTLGNAFTGHRVLTLEGLARAVLSRTGPVPETIGSHLRRALVAELAERRIGGSSRFAGLAAYPGFADLLVPWLEDARSTGSQIASDRDLQRFGDAYDVHLKRLGMTDHEGWIRLALDSPALDRFGPSLEGMFILHGFYDLTDYQRQLVERVIAGSRRCAVTLLYDPARPNLFVLPGRLLERFRELGARVVSIPGRSLPGTGPVARGFRGGDPSGEVDPERVQIHTFRSVESEADWVAGTIRGLLAAGIHDPGEIMVAVRRRPGFGSPLHTALRRNGVPVEGGVPRPLITHPVVRLALAAIEASLQPDDENLLREVRQSAYTRSPDFPEEAPVPDGRSWNCMVEVGSPEDFVLSVRKMLDILGVRSRLNGGGDPLRASAEVAVWTRMQELLDEFVHFYTPLRRIMQAADFVRLLRRFFGEATIPDAPAPGRGVLVADINHARFASRPVVFFTGLDNTAFPGRTGGFSLHDPGYSVLKRTHAELEDPLLFHAVMQGARTLFFTFPGIDDEGRDSTLSPYLREIRDRNASWLRTTFHHGIAGAAWEGGCSTPAGRAEILLRAMKNNSGNAAGLLSHVEKRDPALAERIRRAVRVSADLAEDRGLRLLEPASLEAVRSEWGAWRVFSVTELETYVSCPVRFFLSRMLRLEVARDVRGEMDPAERGTIIHDILARFYRGRIIRGAPGFGSGDMDACRWEMRTACEQVFQEHAETFSALHPVAMLAEKRFIFSWMDTFLEREAEYFRHSGFRPEYLEVDFGRSRGGSGFAPLALGEGETGFLLGGRIDRVDVDRALEIPLLRIIDYKTGERNASLRDLESGRDLQIALYLKAASERILPGCALHDGVFYSLKDLEFSGYTLKRKPLVGESWVEYIRLAGDRAVDAVAGIREGIFPAGECARNGYCDFRALCRGGREAGGEEDADADS